MPDSRKGLGPAKRRMPTWRYKPDTIGHFVSTLTDGSVTFVAVVRLVPTRYAGGYRGPGEDKYELRRGLRGVAPMTTEYYERGLEGWTEVVRKTWPDIVEVGTFDSDRPLWVSPNPPKGCSHADQTRDARQGRETVRAWSQ